MLFKKEHETKKEPLSEEVAGIKHAVDDGDFRDDMPAPPPTEEPSAPLFVKVEKYREVLSGLHEMKLFVAGARDVFSILQELEQVRSDALNVMKVTVQRLEKAVVEMDAELLRPRGVNISPFPQGEAEVRHIESSLSGLQKQLLDLRQELQAMR